ncbi:MAG TPA: hypothetical protein PKA66_14635, partial [Gemmatimonadales bacterium]|nr:hypothetical protein [Gemmatimonadales bacterium]
IYLRGRPPPAVVDLARVRLTGKLTDVHPSPVHGEPFDATTRAALLERFTRAVDALPGSAAVDSFAILRVEALRTAPAFAAALADAIGALRSGREATPDLVRARRSLGELPVVTPALSAWGLP